MKKTVFIIFIILNFVFYLPCEAKDLSEMVYASYEVHAYELPNFGGELVEVVKAGTVLRVIGKDGQWYQVQTSKGKPGWVHSSGLDVDQDVIKKFIASQEEKIARLEAEVKPLPASKIEENLKIYKQLLELAPENKKYQKKVEHYSSRLYLKEKKERAGNDLELLNWAWNHEYGYATAEGQVKNISGRKLKNIQAVVVWYDNNDNMITYNSSYIEYTPVMPGQVSPFRVMVRYNPAMSNARLRFKHPTGSIVPTYIKK